MRRILAIDIYRWPISDCNGSVFGDDQMTAAVIDRIVHHERRAQFRGESYRGRHALIREG